MPCLKLQREWVKAKLAGFGETPRDYDYFLAVLGSLENLQARVDHDVEARRREAEVRKRVDAMEALLTKEDGPHE